MQGGVRSAGSDTSPAQGNALSRIGQRLRQEAGSIRTSWEMWSDSSYRRWARDFELPDGNRRVYCYHVRKTAGTSLFLSFMALGGEDPMDVWHRIAQTRLQRTFSGPYSFASNDRSVLAEGAYLFGRSHHRFSRQPLPPKTLTVTILRDPVERVHSYYDYLVAGDAPDMPGQVTDRERSLAQDGFDTFLDRVPVRALLTQLTMFSDRLDVNEAAERIGSCSSVFFTEDFSAGLASLGQRLELPLEGQRARVTVRRSSLTDDQRERLRVRLEPEYELLRLLDQDGIARRGGPSSN